MGEFVIEYDLDLTHPVTRKLVTKHYVVRPCGGKKEADATKKNLGLNRSIRNLSMKADT